MPFDGRGLLRAVHRDAGYLAAGMTLLYAVSGVALNHLRDWNPDWSVRKEKEFISLPVPAGQLGEADIPILLAAIGEKETPTGIFQPDPGTVQVFFGRGRTVTVDIEGQTAEREFVSRRTILAALDALHLNRASRAWTWLADLYAVALGLLALTGLFILRDGQGLAGRGMWLAAAGVALPLLLAWLTL